MNNPTKIFLVEDEAVTAMFIKMYLNNFNIEVSRIFSTGEAALLQMERECPDLIIMDIHLAGKMDGIEAFQQINLGNPVPVIFITGYSEAEAKARLGNVEPVAFLLKPVNMADLKNAIETGLSKS